MPVQIQMQSVNIVFFQYPSQLPVGRCLQTTTQWNYYDCFWIFFFSVSCLGVDCNIQFKSKKKKKKNKADTWDETTIITRNGENMPSNVPAINKNPCLQNAFCNYPTYMVATNRFRNARPKSPTNGGRVPFQVCRNATIMQTCRTHCCLGKLAKNYAKRPT